MATFLARAPRLHLLPPAALVAAIALLVFASGAFAETKIGEYDAPLDKTIPAEASVTHVSAEYEATNGALTFAVTTGAEPRAEVEGEENEIEMVAALVTLPECTQAGFESAGKENIGYPLFEVAGRYSEPTLALSIFRESEKEAPKYLAGGKEVAGRTTTLTSQNPKAAKRAFTCGVVLLVGVENEAGERAKDVAIFPLTVKPEPPPAEPKPTPAAPEAKPAPAPAPPPPPTPAALSIAKAKKPLRLKVGKWSTARVTVTNTGGTATRPGAVRVKAPEGVLVKPERQKVPILAPGGSWTISVRVQLTAKAKATTTLAVTGTAPGLSTKGTLVVKRSGG
jgi:hypothetical protein